MKMFRYALAVAALLAGAVPASADFLFTVGSGTTSIGFDASHSGTSRCAAANSVCFAFVPMDTAGAAFGVSANPLYIGFGSGVMLPAFASTPAFTISGTLPAFASTPAFTISGTLPAFASTPTFNLGTLNGAATATNQSTMITSLGTIATNSGTQATAANQTTTNGYLAHITDPIPDCAATPCTNHIGLVYQTSQYPAGATPITGNATGTTGAVVGTLTAGSKTAYMCTFDVSAIGGTAAVGPITVAGLTGSSMVFQLASSTSGVTLSRSYFPCIPASASSTNITVTTTADGTATAVSVNSSGFTL